jgi:tripartite-type tricarboxylate transporter receptor subunit TctC
MALCLLTLTVLAEGIFPSQPVTIIIGFPAGSGPDAVLRTISDQLSKKWSVPVVIQNRPGGNGAVGINAYSKEPADGYSLYFSDNNVPVSYPILYNSPKATENLKALVPVTRNEMMLFTNADVKDYRALVENQRCR